jgi:hypothetical protein
MASELVVGTMAADGVDVFVPYAETEGRVVRL